MGKGLPRSTGRGAAQRQEIMTLRVPVRDLTLSVTDGAPGFGAAVGAGLPEGNILYLGCVSYLQFSTTDADVTATWEGDYSLGTAPTADGVLSGAEIDLVPSTPIAAATAQVSPVTRAASTQTEQSVIFDNTDGSLEVNINLLVDDASIAGAADFTVDGAIHIAFIVLGDD